MDNQQPKEKKSNLFFAYGSPQFVIGATLLNMFLNSDFKEEPIVKLTKKEEELLIVWREEEKRKAPKRIFWFLVILTSIVVLWMCVYNMNAHGVFRPIAPPEINEARILYDMQPESYKNSIKCNCD
jgi:hypothetical protein